MIAGVMISASTKEPEKPTARFLPKKPIRTESAI